MESTWSDGAHAEDAVPVADAHEQRRPLVEEGLDPEHVAGSTTSEIDGIEADPLDVRDQLEEVELDDEYPADGQD